MPSELHRRRRMIAQVAIIAGAAAVTAAGATIVATAGRTPSRPLDTDGVKLVDRRTTLDLRAWKETSADDIVTARKISKVVSINEFTIERLHGDGNLFFHRIGTSSAIDPDVDCTNCRIEKIAKKVAPASREWNIVFDIAREPVGRLIPLHFSVTFWNAFQNSDQWWGGFRIIHPTKQADFRVLFPRAHRPLPADVSFAFVDGNTGAPNVIVPAPEEYTFVVGDDGHVEEIDWTIHYPEDDRSYRVYWKWPELTAPHASASGSAASSPDHGAPMQVR